jgi:dihydrodipicolinate synthase/N-acetylneuraminate lyase
VPTYERLRGIWGFPLTPFAGGRVDLEALATAVEYQVAGGIDVICACGMIAEIESLTGEEWRACAAETLAWRGGIPAVVAIPASDDRLETVEAAVHLGADALLVLPHTGDLDLIGRRLRGIAAMAPSLPLVLYHRPPLDLEPAALGRLCELDVLVGLKDGHRDVRRYRRLREAIGERLLWVSAWEDVALPFWALGCDAFAPASVAYEPAYSRAWFECLEAGNVAGARRLLTAHAYGMVDLRLSRPGIDVSVVKAAMAERGLPAGDLRTPAVELAPSERERVRVLLRDLDMALAVGAAETS